LKSPTAAAFRQRSSKQEGKVGGAKDGYQEASGREPGLARRAKGLDKVPGRYRDDRILKRVTDTNGMTRYSTCDRVLSGDANCGSVITALSGVAGLVRLNRPLVVLFDRMAPTRADDGRLVWEDVDDLGPALDLAVEALDRVAAGKVM
jgi:hypothetical protein